MKNIMICLERMEIGGVETSVINQAIEYKKQGIKVIILAKEGIYVEKLKEYGIFFENFEFTLDENIDIQKIEKIKEIINKYKIEEVLINQIPCALSVFPACFELKVPYVAYIHTSVEMIQDNENNVYDWFEKQLDITKYLLPIYFKKAKKVIAISQEAADYAIKRYNIKKENVIVVKNSINLDLYKTNKETNNKEKFLLITRFSDEKMNSIKNAIEVFREYENDNKSLSIVGSGPMQEKVEKLVKDDEKIKLLGSSNDVVPIIDEHDIVLGLDRTILEAISMKKIAVIIGYNKPKQIITNKNIDIEANEGFSGLKLEDLTVKELVKRIKEENIDLEYNYNYVKENLNIKDNIYIENDFSADYKDSDLFEIIEEIQMNKIKYEEEAKNLRENINSKIYEISEIEKELINVKNKNQELKEQNDNIKKELLSLYASKRYKYLNNILKIFGK